VGAAINYTANMTCRACRAWHDDAAICISCTGVFARTNNLCEVEPMNGQQRTAQFRLRELLQEWDIVWCVLHTDRSWGFSVRASPHDVGTAEYHQLDDLLLLRAGHEPWRYGACKLRENRDWRSRPRCGGTAAGSLGCSSSVCTNSRQRNAQSRSSIGCRRGMSGECLGTFGR
jgi:hypothetical protein